MAAELNSAEWVTAIQGRTDGKGTEEKKLLNDEMVQAGMAHHYQEYSDRCPNGGEFLAEAEQEAKVKRLGVWAGEKFWRSP
ncbi:MAG: hypothetical protein DCF22_22380 [Leptolyngbya sp.]|nr:MAG: hypothetical protein DCF22_22380 [Leptolyngbya sp.]